MNEHKKILNEFLVDTFNDILRQEEIALAHLSNHTLSISEVHVLEAVFKSLEAHENTATAIARLLRITMGSLTVAIKTLEKKGYLYRERTESDKRVVRIIPTPLAVFVNQKHHEFHVEMIDEIVKDMSLEEEKSLVNALQKVRIYFQEKSEKTK